MYSSLSFSDACWSVTSDLSIPKDTLLLLLCPRAQKLDKGGFCALKGRELGKGGFFSYQELTFKRTEDDLFTMVVKNRRHGDVRLGKGRGADMSKTEAGCG